MGNSCGNCASSNVEAINEFIFGSKDIPEKKIKSRNKGSSKRSGYCDPISYATKIQSIWRGYYVRKYIKNTKSIDYFTKEEYNEVNTRTLTLSSRTESNYKTRIKISVSI